MARIRTVKPQFYGSASIARCTIEARYLAIGLISMSDDEGRFLGSVNAIAGFVFPHDAVPVGKLTKWLKELTAAGYLVLYTEGGLQYGYLPGFVPNQRINKATRSALPPPPPESLFDAEGVRA